VEWVHLNMTGSPPPMVKLWTFCEKKRATTSSRQRFDMDSGKGHIESAVPVRRSCTQLHLFGQMDALRILTPDDRVLPWVMDGTRGKGIEGIGSSLRSILKRFKTTAGGFGRRIARRFGCASNHGALRGARGVAASSSGLQVFLQSLHRQTRI